jgi:3'-5' exoribonuclease 1
MDGSYNKTPPNGYLCCRMENRHFIIYDLEATCWRSRAPKRVEVIEIGAVKVNESLDIIDEFCAFVRPTLHPQISKFCTQLTSITQADVDGAPHFEEAIEAFEDWISPKANRAVLMSWGEFDKRQLLSDSDLHQMELPWLRYHACLQHHYSKWKGSKNQIGLKSAMELEGLSYSGTQHRAIEDARNMARLFQVIAGPMELVTLG